MKPSHRRLFPLLALLLGLALALLAGEAAVRWLDPVGSRRDPVPAGPWRPGMGRSVQGVTRMVEGGRELVVPYRTNSVGFRDDEHAPAKPAGTARVAVLGDSFLAGLAVPQEQIFPEVLERRLAGRAPAIEVLAFGTVGYGTGLELITFQEVAAGFAPDVVVLSFFQNDPWDNAASLGSQRAPYFQFDEGGALRRVPPAQAGKAAPGGVSRWLNRYSRLYVFQKALTRRVVDAYKYRSRRGVGGLPKVYRPLVEPPIPGIDDAWELTLALVDRLHAEVEAAGARLVVMDIPLQEGVSPTRFAASAERFPALTTVSMDWDRSVLRLGSHCLQRGIPYLDLRVPLTRAGDPAPMFFAEDGHFTVAGHRAVGEALAAFLLRRDLL